MKPNKSTLFLIVITFFTTLLSQAQKDFQGVATYQTKTTVDLDKWGGGKMSPERKKMIMERMKNMLEKTYTLTFNKEESTYKEDEKLEAPDGRGFGGMMSSFSAGVQYKNVKNYLFLQDQEFFGKQFLIKDSLQNLEWKMTGETRQIGKYLCMKATAMKKVDKMDWKNMRPKRRRGKQDEAKRKEGKAEIGKGKEGEREEGKGEEVKKETENTEPKDLMNEVEVPKEVEVTAWYTMQIPVSHGPGEYWGLPGLILEVSSGKTTILCSKIVVNPDEKEEIKQPTKGKEVTKDEYQTIVKKKMEEMREMYGGRNRGKGRPMHGR
jgi:GLPGLI family protein